MGAGPEGEKSLCRFFLSESDQQPSGASRALGILLSLSHSVSDPMDPIYLAEACPRSKGAVPARESFLPGQFGAFRRNWTD